MIESAEPPHLPPHDGVECHLVLEVPRRRIQIFDQAGIPPTEKSTPLPKEYTRDPERNPFVRWSIDDTGKLEGPRYDGRWDGPRDHNLLHSQHLLFFYLLCPPGRAPQVSQTQIRELAETFAPRARHPARHARAELNARERKPLALTSSP